jgi:fumarate hydratase class II
LVKRGSPRLAIGSRTVVTPFDGRIGYERRVTIGRAALAENIALKQAAEKRGYIRPDDCLRRVIPWGQMRPRATLPGGGI